MGAHPAVNDDHVLGVAVQPGLLRLADCTHLIQGWCVQLWPAHVQNLWGKKGGFLVSISKKPYEAISRPFLFFNLAKYSIL